MSESRAHVALLVDVSNLRAGLIASTPTTASVAAASVAQPGEAAACVPGLAAAAPAEGTRWGGQALADVARALMRYASQVGRVTLARAYADWSRLGGAARDVTAARLSPVLVPASVRGEDRSHIQLAVDALQALFAGDEPEAFLLVTGDATLLPLVQALRADGSEVIVITSAAAADDELRAEADRFVPLEDVLAGVPAVPVEARDRSPDRSPDPGESARSLALPGGPSASGARSAWVEPGARAPRAGRTPHPTPILGPDLDTAAYDWAPFVRLIDELEQRLPFVGVRYLVNKVLGGHNCGTEDPRLKRELINRAVDDGLIEMFPVGNVGERADPVTACRLDRSHTAVLDVLGPTTRPVPVDEDPLRRAASPSVGGLASD